MEYSELSLITHWASKTHYSVYSGKQNVLQTKLKTSLGLVEVLLTLEPIACNECLEHYEGGAGQLFERASYMSLQRDWRVFIEKVQISCCSHQGRSPDSTPKQCSVLEQLVWPVWVSPLSFVKCNENRACLTEQPAMKLTSDWVNKAS